MADNGGSPEGRRSRAGADEVLALHLASGRPVGESARLAGVSDRTASRRLADPAFRARVRALRGQMTSRAAGILAEGQAAASVRLRLLVNSRDERVALAAATTVLKLACELGQAADGAEARAELDAIAHPPPPWARAGDEDDPA